MYDSPKAAHFDAYHDRELLPRTGLGLRLRWDAAVVVENILKIRSMIGLTDADKKRIDERLALMFAGTGFSVRRREHGEGMEASGEAEHADW